jgi:hypothetical protein
MKKYVCKFLGSLLIGLPMCTAAFQLAPLGSKFEARLTNETESSLAKVAAKVGVLLKSPVHEEITQLGLGCPANPSDLSKDTTCSGADYPFATPFIIYGVRWNDLPPFRLTPAEGNCNYLGKSCNLNQTIRFSTQPVCWYCLFKDAQKKAQTQKITGCEKRKSLVRGNVMTRSHFGDLQFLHGMASEDGVDPNITRAKIIDWIEFAWKVSSREIKADQFLREINIGAIQAHFGCTAWRVSDLYILGRQDPKSGLLLQIRKIALGSVLHTVQDSFAMAHTSRETMAPEGLCSSTGYKRPARVMEFHVYGLQDEALHDEQDSRSSMVGSSTADRWPEAVEATRALFAMHEDNIKWQEAKPYVDCLFELAPEAQRSSPGAQFKKFGVEKM